MAHIFKYFDKANNEKGIFSVTHNEMNLFDTFPADIRERYYIGVSYASASWITGAKRHAWQDFCTGTTSLVNFVEDEPFRIPLTHSSFTPDYFCENPSVPKFWDIINVSRNHKIKCLRSFLYAIRKLYDEGHFLRVLLVVPSTPNESSETHYVELVQVYSDLFNRQERKRFTLMRLSPELGFLGISPETIAYFYQSSKVSALFSLSEGEPRVINESLLCGVPVVCYAGQKGAGLDHLNTTNSVQFDDYEQSWKALLEAVNRAGDDLVADTAYMAEQYNETRSLPKLRAYFQALYQQHGDTLKGELVNTDELNLRLPAHFKEVPWFVEGDVNATITREQQVEVFYAELRKT